MSKLYVLAHPLDRFKTDFFPCLNRPTNSQLCQKCGRTFESVDEDLAYGYYWDTEFGNPGESFDLRHAFFWGGFRPIVSNQARKALLSLGDQFLYKEATELFPEEVEVFRDSRKDELAPYFWVSPKAFLMVDREENKIDICSICGKFSDSPKQVTRIRVSERQASMAEAFRIQENRGFAIFVTEEFRSQLKSLGLHGIGYHNAGRLV